MTATTTTMVRSKSLKATKDGKKRKEAHVEVLPEESDNPDPGESNAEDTDEDAVDADDESLADSENSGEADDDASEGRSASNSGWADAMQKILRSTKPKKRKTLVLSKAKKLCDVDPSKLSAAAGTPAVSFEVDGEATPEVKVEVPDGAVKEDSRKVQKQRKERKLLGVRVKPDAFDRQRERLLQKIATKGVVQLFNTVRLQQTEIERKLIQAGGAERKREEVLKGIDKRQFLKVLTGNSKSISISDAVKKETENEKEQEQQGKDSTEKTSGDQAVWSVLRDDFVMSAGLKDWDKEDEDEEEEEDEAEETQMEAEMEWSSDED